jgi:hypothetical protein
MRREPLGECPFAGEPVSGDQTLGPAVSAVKITNSPIGTASPFCIGDYDGGAHEGRWVAGQENTLALISGEHDQF